jgi:hypothetical protein
MSDQNGMASEAQKVALQELERDFQAAAQDRSPYEGTWYLNLAYYAGDQWLTWDGARLSKPKLRKGRILITDNRIQPAIRMEIAKMTKSLPSWSCTPDSPAEDAVEGARRATRAMEAKWGPDELALHAKLSRALHWSRVTGAGFWKITWDSGLGKGRDVVVGPDGKVARGDNEEDLDPQLLNALPEDHELRQVLRVQKVNQGDVRVEVRSPFEFYPDPLAEGMDELERCWEEVVLSPAASRPASAST